MVTINQDACTGCGRCIKDCIAGTISLQDHKARSAGSCLLCGHCVAVCPTGAVSIPEYDMEDVEELAPEEAALETGRLLKAIKSRRSIRSYKQMPVSRSYMELLLQAGRYTATARNTQGCRFIFVQEGLGLFKSMIWEGIGRILNSPDPGPAEPYRNFYNARQADPQDDYLFRNAPCVLFIAAHSAIDAGLAAQNMELTGTSLGLGFLYNGYLRRAAQMIPEAREWLETGGKPLEACALLGFPDVTYKRTAPRRAADVVFH